MAFVLQPPVFKRLKHIDQTGREDAEDQDNVAFREAAAAAAQAAVQPGSEASTEATSAEEAPAATTPREVLDKLIAAKGELDVVLDLINLMEGQHYLGVANIARPMNLQLQEQESALQLQQKVHQLQDAGSRLRKGAASMRAHAAKHDFFFAQLAQLQQRWTLQRSQPGTGAAGPFQVDVALPMGRQWQLNRKEQQPNTIVGVVEAADGTLQLQSGGLPLSDQPLRWLRPLHRPPLAASLSSNDQSSVASQEQQHSAVRQPIQIAAQQQVAGHAPGQSQDPEATGMQSAQANPAVSHLQGQTTQAGLDPAKADVPKPALQQAQQQSTAQEGASGPDAMQVDSPQAATQHLAVPHASDADTSMQSVQAEQENLTLHGWLPSTATQQQSQPQQQHQQQYLPKLPEDIQERVRQNVAKCDRQLLGRQEALLARWLPQRVEDEVRAKHGAADVDDTAVGFVQQVLAAGAEANPILGAVQMRLLRLLLADVENNGLEPSLMGEILRLSHGPP